MSSMNRRSFLARGRARPHIGGRVVPPHVRPVDFHPDDGRRRLVGSTACSAAGSTTGCAAAGRAVGSLRFGRFGWVVGVAIQTFRWRQQC